MHYEICFHSKTYDWSSKTLPEATHNDIMHYEVFDYIDNLSYHAR